MQARIRRVQGDDLPPPRTWRRLTYELERYANMCDHDAGHLARLRAGREAKGFFSDNVGDLDNQILGKRISADVLRNLAAAVKAAL